MSDQSFNVHCRHGYIALLSILIVSAMAAATVLILFVTGITSTMNSADSFNGRLAHALSEACMERSLQSLTSCDILCHDGTQLECDDGTAATCSMAAPYEIVFGSNKCQIVAFVNTAANIWRIRTTGVVGTVKKYIEVEASKTPLPALLAAGVTAWRECLAFPALPALCVAP